jgi:C1A family cysteine protease
VLAVGILTDAPGQRVIVKNSWGEDWGTAGYGFVMRGYIESYLKKAFVVDIS